jgi:hypothetical protein
MPTIPNEPVEVDEPLIFALAAGNSILPDESITNRGFVPTLSSSSDILNLSLSDASTPTTKSFPPVLTNIKEASLSVLV